MARDVGLNESSLMGMKNQSKASKMEGTPDLKATKAKKVKSMVSSMNMTPQDKLTIKRQILMGESRDNALSSHAKNATDYQNQKQSDNKGSSFNLPKKSIS